MNSNLNYIKSFASCIPVKGAKRSLICDLQRGSYNFITNDLYDVLIQNDGKTLNEIKLYYKNQFDEIIDQYYEFLFENEFVFYTKYPELFPKMSLEWYSPLEINNSIIDVGDDLNYEKNLTELDVLKCKSVEFRFYKSNCFEIIQNILSFVDKNKLIIYSLGFVLPHSKDTEYKKLKKLIIKYPRISYFIITNSTQNKFIEPIRRNMGYVFYTADMVESIKHCGLINSSNFVVNTGLFSESQNHNTCLNRKISIDKDGNIKNCPSMTESFGNIKDTTLEEALNKPGFKKYWNINKDQIEVCKDCEFRHICTDCRAYIEDPENQYSKPLKCGYNPYTNVWEEWSTNPLKQKAIEYYGMQDLVKKDL